MRWVYLDIGKFGGLAETMDESIRYPIRTAHDGDEMAPCVLAGPTCDSADVMYEKKPYMLPVSLSIGDKVLIEGAGAYTTTYSAVAFNGFPPLRSYVESEPAAGLAPAAPAGLNPSGLGAHSPAPASRVRDVLRRKPGMAGPASHEPSIWISIRSGRAPGGEGARP